MSNATARHCRKGHDLAKVGTYRIGGYDTCKTCHREGIAQAKARMQAIRSHELELATPQEHERFWAKVDKSGDCWTWTGAPHSMGYGVCTLAGKPQLAHRVSFHNFVAPVEDGLEIDHLCSNKACMNPAHLEQVTHQENCMRGVIRRAA